MAINCSRCGDIESEADHKPTCPHGIAHFQYQRGFSAGEASMRERAAGVCEDIAKQHAKRAQADDGNKAGVRTHSGIQSVTYAAAAQHIRALKGAT